MMDPATFKREFLLSTPKSSTSDSEDSPTNSTQPEANSSDTQSKSAEGDDNLQAKLNDLSLSNPSGSTSVEEAKKKQDASEESTELAEDTSSDNAMAFTTTGYVPSDSVGLRDTWISMGYPSTVIRLCKDPITRDPFSVWLCYPDTLELYPTSHNFVRSPTASELENKPFNVVDLPGKGKGCRATRNIVRGETLLRETPLFIAPLYVAFPKTRDYTDDVGFKMHDMFMERGMDYLLPEDKARIMDLVNVQEEKYPHTGRFKTNGVGCTFHGAKLTSYGGICPIISRVNHSCSPNSSYAFVAKSLYVELRAIRPIAKGEEITLSYCDVLDSYSTRQAELLRKFNFTCRCRACNVPRSSIAESDARRDCIQTLVNKSNPSFHAWYNGNNGMNNTALSKSTKSKPKGSSGGFGVWKDDESITSDELINAYTVLLRLIDVEKIYEDRGKPIRWLAFVYAALGDLKMFKKWAAESVEYGPTVSGGPEGFCDNEVRKMKGYLETPTTHPYWAKRIHWNKNANVGTGAGGSGKKKRK